MPKTTYRLCAIHAFLALTLATNLAAAQSSATPVAFGAAVSGTIATEVEVDWYSVTVDVVGDLTVTQTAWPPFIETRIAIFGPNSQTLTQSNPVTAAAPGIYYIKVWSAVGGTSTDVYTFSATLAKAGTGNDIDKGTNSAAAAVPIVLATPVSDTIAPSKETATKQDVDWFTVTTDVVGDLTVTQTAWPPFIETRIAIFGPNSETLAQANPVPAAAPGTYYIKVWSGVDGSSIAPYTFTASLVVAKTGNDIDSGKNSAAGAVAIVMGTPVSDTIAPSKETAGKQDEDWFTVTAAVTGDLTVTQTVWPPYIDTKIAIFGPNSATVAQNNPVLGATPGTYYIKVWSAADGSSIAPYTFTVNQVGAVLPPPPVDGGVVGIDSGRPDAGALDGRALDVALLGDAPRADAGALDVRAVDVGLVTGDTALIDSRTADAQPIDGTRAIDGSPYAVDSAGPPTAMADGGTTGSDKSSGCSGSCSTAGHATGRSPGLIFLGLALALIGLRRQTRR